jgi:hypothetical protein
MDYGVKNSVLVACSFDILEGLIPKTSGHWAKTTPKTFLISCRGGYPAQRFSGTFVI